MKPHDTPIEGIYTIWTPDFKGGYNKPQFLPVLVVGETEKEYCIKARVPIRGRKPMEPLSVRKRNIKFRTVMGEPVRVEA